MSVVEYMSSLMLATFGTPKGGLEGGPGTVLLKGNVANERLSLLVSRSNSHATRETKRTELKPL